jgi:predicted RNase H-like nuclease
MKFIGIDLGWVSGASGLCCLSWQNERLEILELTTKLEIAEILTWIDNWIPLREPGLIAVDAPTIITNQTGMRLADKLAHKYFGRYHAGCYPANLNLAFADRTIGFGKSLLAKNFVHAPTIEPQTLGRYQIEVFPHAATINLFKLERILKYKKGRLACRQVELDKLRRYIDDVLPRKEPFLNLNSHSLPRWSDRVKGKELKTIEDMLDSLLCAYIAAHWWYWGMAKNLVLGDLARGYIIVPAP